MIDTQLFHDVILISGGAHRHDAGAHSRDDAGGAPPCRGPARCRAAGTGANLPQDPPARTLTAIRELIPDDIRELVPDGIREQIPDDIREPGTRRPAVSWSCTDTHRLARTGEGGIICRPRFDDHPSGIAALAEPASRRSGLTGLRPSGYGGAQGLEDWRPDGIRDPDHCHRRASWSAPAAGCCFVRPRRGRTLEAPKSQTPARGAGHDGPRPGAGDARIVRRCRKTPAARDRRARGRAGRRRRRAAWVRLRAPAGQGRRARWARRC